MWFQQEQRLKTSVIPGDNDSRLTVEARPFPVDTGEVFAHIPDNLRQAQELLETRNCNSFIPAFPIGPTDCPTGMNTLRFSVSEDQKRAVIEVVQP
jgi:hypothetical protein